MAYILLTCEHASNRIPKKYKSLFTGIKRILQSHRGFDIGALELTRKIAKGLCVPYIPGLTSRLLVELNRSLNHPSLFSSFTKILPLADREEILANHYLPYRQLVEQMIETQVKKQEQVIHIAVHSFAPKLDGLVRTADIGVLYDPSKPAEKTWAKRFKSYLADSSLRVRFNYPYRGVADGFPTYLRTKFSAENYVGIELEVNQQFLEEKKEFFFKRHLVELVGALRAANQNKID